MKKRARNMLMKLTLGKKIESVKSVFIISEETWLEEDPYTSFVVKTCNGIDFETYISWRDDDLKIDCSQLNLDDLKMFHGLCKALVFSTPVGISL